MGIPQIFSGALAVAGRDHALFAEEGFAVAFVAYRGPKKGEVAIQFAPPVLREGTEAVYEMGNSLQQNPQTI